MLRLGQARTGTGKTLAFLIPVLQQIINHEPELEKRRNRDYAPDIRAIIISPTRELAEQIHAEAMRLVKETNVRMQLAVGGTTKGFHLQKMRREGCHVLVGTPGRLKDLLSDPRSGVRAPDLHTFVLDEADRLLDDGFGPDIQEIRELLPDTRDQNRQTLLFSATFPKEVMRMVSMLMKKDYEFIQTVQPGEQQTHAHVPQRLVPLAGLENFLPTLVELCKGEAAKRAEDPSAPPFKAIVFFNTSALATLAYQAFRSMREAPGANARPGVHAFFGINFLEMHAKLTQQRRTRTASDFRAARSAVMFSSDVSARGMDFPNVTHVISVGCPPQRDTYVHRIGRTARVNKPGEAWLLVAPLEQREAQTMLEGLPLTTQGVPPLPTASVDMAQGGDVPAEAAAVLEQSTEAARNLDRGTLEAAYRSMLGALQRFAGKQRIVDAINRLAAHGWGMEQPPAVPPGLVQKLGMSGTHGLNIQNRFRDRQQEGQGYRMGQHGYANFKRGRGDGGGSQRYDGEGYREDYDSRKSRRGGRSRY